MAAIPSKNLSVGCEVCEREGTDNCHILIGNENLQNISGQAKFGIDPEKEMYIYNVYAVDTTSSIRLDDCIYAQFIYNVDAASVSGR